MDCPKCTGHLQAESYGDSITIHRCDTCAGLWCKQEALAEMKDTWMAEAVLDIGNPRIGNTMDALGDIHCPEGHGKMNKRDDDRQRHIWYEECSTCHGVFLDAGEFTDLKHDTLLDRVRGVLKGGRPLS